MTGFDEEEGWVQLHSEGSPYVPGNEYLLREEVEDLPEGARAIYNEHWRWRSRENKAFRAKAKEWGYDELPRSEPTIITSRPAPCARNTGESEISG